MVMGPCVRRDDSGERSRDTSCPKFCISFGPQIQRAQGRPGARRTRGLMGVLQSNRLPTSIQVWLKHSGLPHAMALRLIRDRPGDPALCDTIALGPLSLPSNLTPASGRQTQTISPYVKRRARQSRTHVHRFPAPRLRRWPTPLWWDRMRESILRIFRFCQRFIFDLGT